MNAQPQGAEGAPLKLWYNESDWVIAKDPDDAWAVLTEQTGLTRADFDKGDASDFWKEWTRPLAIHDGDAPPSMNAPRKTPEQWIAEKGRGYIGSSEW
jgi:hypothetical protein